MAIATITPITMTAAAITAMKAGIPVSSMFSLLYVKYRTCLGYHRQDNGHDKGIDADGLGQGTTVVAVKDSQVTIF